VRSSSTVVIHKDNVEALVVPAGDTLSSANANANADANAAKAPK
jgi:hypothetical protein